MNRKQFAEFVRALVATLLAALTLWAVTRLGVTIRVPLPPLPTIGAPA